MINLTVVIDNDEALKKLKELQNVAKQTTSKVVSDSERMDAMFGKLKGTIAGLASVAALKEFVSEIAKVRGEVQQLEVAFETMLGSKQKSDALMSEVIDLAAKTPFGLQDVSNATKMLLAYGSSAEEVAEEIKMLGNIASGLSIPLGDLIYLYGTTRTQGRMFTQDLRQFMGRGIPLAEELAKQFGVTKDEVGALVTDGKVGFEKMAKALQSMAGEGGKFYNLMEKQSATISGQMSNLEDSIYQMFNALGKQSEGVISSAISGVSSLVENYERVGRTIASLVAIYGTYKAAVMAYSAVTTIAANAAVGMTIAEQARTVALIAAEKAQKLLNATMLKNPYVLVATLIATVVAAIVMQKNETERLREAEEKYAAAKDDIIAKEEEHKRKIEELVNVAEDESRSTEERRRALVSLEMQYPSIFANYDTEAEKLANIKRIKEEIAALEARGSITEPKNELEKVEKRIEELDKKNRSKVTWTSSLGKTVSYGGLSADEKAELKNLQNRREELKSKIYNNYVTDVVAGVGELTDGLLDSTLQQLKSEQDRRKRIGSNNYEYGVMGANTLVEDLESTNAFTGWTDDQIQAYIQRIEGEKSARAQEKYTVSELQARAENKVAEAEKALAAFDASEKKGDEQTLKAERQKLVDAIETAKDEAKNIGVTAAKKARGGSRATAVDDTKRKLLEASRLTEQLTQENVESKIDLMDEGLDKTLAQIDKEYEQRKKAILKYEAELKSLQGTLTPEQKKEIDNAYAFADSARAKARDNAMDAEKKQMEKSMNEYLILYGDYQEKRNAIADKYNALISEAANEWDTKMLEKERDNALKDLDISLAAKSDLWVRLFEDASRLTNKQVKNVIASTKTLLDYLKGVSTIKPEGFTDEQLESLKQQPEAIKAIYDALEEKQRAFDERTQYPFANLIKAITKYKEAHLEAQKAQKATTEEEKRAAEAKAVGLKADAEKNIRDAAGQAAEAVTALSDAFEKLAEASGDERIKEAAEQFSSLAHNLSAAGQGAASGGWIGAIVGGVTDMLSQSVNAVATNMAEVEEMTQNAVDFIREYQLMMLSINDADYESIFGVKTIERAQEAYKKAQEALEAYYASVNEQLELPEDDKEARSWGGLVFSGFLWLGKRSTELQKGLEEAFAKGYSALEGIQVKTLDRSGWANFWGAKDQYTSLKDLAPELWSEDGSFNIEAAEAFLATNTQITDEQRAQIQNVVDLARQYEDLQGIIDEQLRNIFGDLSGDVTDIIFDSVRNGTDAWDAFGKKGSEIIDKLGKQMLQEVFVQAYFDQYLERLRDAYGKENPQEELALITSEMFANMGEMVEAATKAAAEWDANASKMGFDMDDIGQTSGARGFQAMSQDTGDELNGRFTDIQGKTTAINEAVQYIKSLSVSQLKQTTSINETLAQIHNDTSLIEKHTRELSLIREGIDRMNRNIEKI